FNRHYTPLEIFCKITQKIFTIAEEKQHYKGQGSITIESAEDFLLNLKTFFQDKDDLSRSSR
ncbi:MAG: hypothetical protein EBU93_06190, partial [Chlamydiae bacterium]|nr:hypothetical protein [Chlamydiota bacterium]